MLDIEQQQQCYFMNGNPSTRKYGQDDLQDTFQPYDYMTLFSQHTEQTNQLAWDVVQLHE